MRRVVIVPIILIILAVISYFLIDYSLSVQKTRNSNKTLSYYRFPKNMSLDESNEINTCFKEAFVELSAENKTILQKCTHATDAHIIFFDNLTTLEYFLDHLVKLKLPHIKFIYGMHGSDFLTGKNYLYETMLHASINQKINQVDKIKPLFPETYLLPQQIDDVKKNFDKNKLYIVKNNQQRQQGCMITNNIKFIESNVKNYVVCQELLQDPLLINKRKINMRIYIFVHLYDNQCQFYINNNGFIYYTRKEFKAGSHDPDHNITTGYIDRKVYTDNPLTIQDLQTFMNKNPDTYNFALLYNNILKAMSVVSDVYAPILVEQNQHLARQHLFSVYGCDIAPSADLSVKIMEINKGPDLTYKDDRDRAVKFEMVKDMLNNVFYNHPLKTFINVSNK